MHVLIPNLEYIHYKLFIDVITFFYISLYSFFSFVIHTLCILHVYKYNTNVVLGITILVLSVFILHFIKINTIYILSVFECLKQTYTTFILMDLLICLLFIIKNIEFYFYLNVLSRNYGPIEIRMTKVCFVHPNSKHYIYLDFIIWCTFIQKENTILD